MENELKKLNRDSFQAEDDANRELLEQILADDFRIFRSNLTIEDKQTMLNRVAADTSQRKREIDEESEIVKVFGNTAVVCCRLILKEKDDTVVGHFWNTKLFGRSGEEWKCVVWQVARLT
jgi:hypothetical protein